MNAAVEEEWRPVFHLIATEFENYFEVSNLGRVRSLNRTVEFIEKARLKRRKVIGRILRTYLTGVGRQRNAVDLAHGQGNGEREKLIVSRLVWEAFHGETIPEGSDVVHLNRVWNDDRLENLLVVRHVSACQPWHRRNPGPPIKRR